MENQKQLNFVGKDGAFIYNDFFPYRHFHKNDDTGVEIFSAKCDIDDNVYFTKNAIVGGRIAIKNNDATTWPTTIIDFSDRGLLYFMYDTTSDYKSYFIKISDFSTLNSSLYYCDKTIKITEPGLCKMTKMCKKDKLTLETVYVDINNGKEYGQDEILNTVKDLRLICDTIVQLDAAHSIVSLNGKKIIVDNKDGRSVIEKWYDYAYKIKANYCLLYDKIDDVKQSSNMVVFRYDKDKDKIELLNPLDAFNSSHFGPLSYVRTFNDGYVINFDCGQLKDRKLILNKNKKPLLFQTKHDISYWPTSVEDVNGSIFDAYDGLARIKRKETAFRSSWESEGLIRKNGTEFVECGIWIETPHFDKKKFGGKYIVLKRNSTCKLIDRNGDDVLPITTISGYSYNDIEEPINGYIPVKISKSGEPRYNFYDLKNEKYIFDKWLYYAETKMSSDRDYLITVSKKYNYYPYEPDYGDFKIEDSVKIFKPKTGEIVDIEQ